MYVHIRYLKGVHIITARKQSLEQGNVFTPVCHSVGGGLHPGVSASRGVCIRGFYIQRGLDRPPTPADTTGYGQRAGGTHPIGMHSSFSLFALHEKYNDIVSSYMTRSNGVVAPWFEYFWRKMDFIRLDLSGCMKE